MRKLKTLPFSYKGLAHARPCNGFPPFILPAFHREFVQTRYCVSRSLQIAPNANTTPGQMHLVRSSVFSRPRLLNSGFQFSLHKSLLLWRIQCHLVNIDALKISSTFEGESRTLNRKYDVWSQLLRDPLAFPPFHDFTLI